jgi:uncharacterized protein (UPF0261 family)
MATVLVIGTLDTKGPETLYLAQRIAMHGCDTLVLDSGILGEPSGIVPDITRAQVAIAAGSTIDALRNAGTRGAAVQQMLVGVRKVALDLYAQGRLQGVVALGGAEGSVLAAAAMKALPHGVPKLVVSPIASGSRTFGPFVGTRDVMVMHSVVDILGLNVVSLPVFDNAAAAISGMALAYASTATTGGAAAASALAKKTAASTSGPAARQIAVTMLGNTTRPLMWLKQELQPDGLELVIFHANGIGGQAMEELIGQQAFDGIIDYTLSEIIGAIGGGFHVASDDRLEAAGRAGLPQIVVPGCIDFLVFGARHEVPAALQSRPSYFHNPEFTLVRASREEQLEAARVIARKLNGARGATHLVVPTRGLSIPNTEGGAFWDPELDDAFRATLSESLAPSVTYEEVDAHINDQAFVEVIATRARERFAATVRKSHV